LVGLEVTAPDIVCLQELKAPDDKFPAAALRAAGYGAVWHGQKSWNGVAILARGDEPVETLDLPVAMSDSGQLIGAALGGLACIWRDGYRYKKAGVMLLDLHPAPGRHGTTVR
jgi:exonuclease III